MLTEPPDTVGVVEGEVRQVIPAAEQHNYALSRPMREEAAGQDIVVVGPPLDDHPWSRLKRLVTGLVVGPDLDEITAVLVPEATVEVGDHVRYATEPPHDLTLLGEVARMTRVEVTERDADGD